jgi:hypothetical protein
MLIKKKVVPVDESGLAGWLEALSGTHLLLAGYIRSEDVALVQPERRIMHAQITGRFTERRNWPGGGENDF